MALLIPMLLGVAPPQAEPTGFRFIASVALQAKDMQTDRMGNLYLVSQTNQLYKYDPSGKLLGTLNYAYIGNITHIDVSNPFQLYLFYRELNAVVYLDNNLAFRGRINLADAGVIQASSAARNYANGLWVFDQGDLQLKKIEDNTKVVQVSGNVLQFAQNKTLAPNFIFDNGTRVFVNDSTEGIMVFDIFANYQKTMPFKGLKDFKILGDELYYVENKSLKAYDMKSLQRKTLALPDSSFTNLAIERERIYLQKKDTVFIYALPVRER